MVINRDVIFHLFFILIRVIRGCIRGVRLILKMLTTFREEIVRGTSCLRFDSDSSRSQLHVGVVVYKLN